MADLIELNLLEILPLVQRVIQEYPTSKQKKIQGFGFGLENRVASKQGGLERGRYILLFRLC